MRMYEPVVRWSLRWKWWVIGGAVALVAVTVPVFTPSGSEFMPPLAEGSLVYMPTTMPGISISAAETLLQIQDRAIKQFPEVRSRARQGGARRHDHRSRAAIDARDRDHAQADVQWRSVDTWYSGGRRNG